MKTSSTISIVIPTWNGKDLLINCLKSLAEQSYKAFEVIIVDNYSTDGTREYINRYFPDIKIIELDKNYGFAKAVNQGIKISKNKYIVLLNNDTKADKSFLKYIVESAEKHIEAGMIASKMLNFYNKDIIDSAGDYIDAVGHANNIGMEESSKKFNKPGYVFLVNGGGSLFKREMLNKVGLLDEDFFAYFEDVDLCFRAQLMGYKAWYEPKAIVYHIHKATSNRNKNFTEYLQFRNMTMNIIKNYPMALLIYDFNWLKILLVNLNTIRFMSNNNLLKEALQAEFYILSHLSDLIKKRKKIQSNIKVSSEYIISNVLPKKITFFGLFKKGI